MPSLTIHLGAMRTGIEYKIVGKDRVLKDSRISRSERIIEILPSGTYIKYIEYNTNETTNKTQWIQKTITADLEYGAKPEPSPLPTPTPQPSTDVTLADFAHADKQFAGFESKYLSLLNHETNQAHNLKVEYSRPISFSGKSATKPPEREYTEIINGWWAGNEKSRQKVNDFWYWVDYPCRLWALETPGEPIPTPTEPRKQYLMEIEVTPGVPVDKDLLLATISPKIRDMGYVINNIAVDGNIVRIYVHTQGSVFVIIFALAVILAIAVIIGVIAWRITEIESQRVMVAQKAATTAEYIITNEEDMLKAGWTHAEKMKVVDALNETAKAGVEPSMPGFQEMGTLLVGMMPVVLLLLVLSMVKK